MSINAESKERLDGPRLVVGIGASAGGLDACRKFLATMPAGSGMAIIVVMHLDPNRESRIGEIFRTSTILDVVQVSEPHQLRPDRVYVIAPDTSLEVRDGVLTPHKPQDPRGQRHPVDTLFSSLAEDQKERAVGVVMSGTGNDGSSGVRDIKGLGGLCLAQDPATAEYDGMPQSAIGTGVVDHVVAPEQMPKILLEYAEHPGAVPGGGPRTPFAHEFDLILDLLSRTYRVNVRSSYKRGTLRRRTERRMGLKQAPDLRAYLEILRDDPAEVALLYGDLLIGVTQFFRDPGVWEELETDFLPGILAREGETPLKIWIAGCATGEEAYTLAIVVLEAIERSRRSREVQIFATDVAENALALARRGVYPAGIRDSISPERLSRFFHQQGQSYEIGRAVRDVVTFAVHNLLSDPPFSRVDLVSCRNVLIYLEEHAQRRVLDLFHFALKPGGLLLLGGSETVGQQANLFETASQKARIHRSTATSDTARNQHLHLPAQWVIRGGDAPVAAAPITPRGPKVNRMVEQIVLGRYAPACVAVTESFEIQSLWGPTHQYLLQPTGEVRMDLLSWAMPGIYPKLRTALEQARDAKQNVTVPDMRVERDGAIHGVQCTIEPITPIPGESWLFLVSFRDTPRPPAAEVTGAADSAEPLVRQLDAENKEVRRELQTTVEQLERTDQEYRASHEELLSLNEELQSNNEELQASKEELQSLNEELLTVNRQLEERNVEFRLASGDLQNLITSTDIPIIFLDRDLRVRRFMPAATQLMRLVPSDIGRSIEHIKQRFHDQGGLVRDAQTALEKLAPLTNEVQTEDGRWYTRIVRPYRTREDRVEGVCVAFFEITGQKQAAVQHVDARRSAERMVAESPAALLVVDADMRVVTATKAFCNLFRVSKEETEGVCLYDLGNRQWDIPRLRHLLERILPEQEEVRDYEVDLDFQRLGRRLVRVHGRRLSRGDMAPYVLLSFEDLTERLTVEALKTRAEELAREHQRGNEFLAMLGHELRNPLAALIHGIDLLGAVREDQTLEDVRRMMVRQTKRIGSMLDQLLDVARLTSGKIRLTKVPVDLAEAARGAIEAVTPLVTAHKHALAVSLPPAGEAVVQGDLARLTQVIENLLSNAAKYTDDGGKIDLTIELDEARVRLYVRDNGIGMDSDLLPHIFELFTQAPRTLERSAGGLGLGLPVVKEVVEMHGGSVEATSPGHGQGSAFVVSLPHMSEGPSAARTDGSDEGAGPSAARPKRILIVDDEQDTRTGLAILLRVAGHEAVAVPDGLAALEAARSFRPDAVLVDLGLPKMNGYEVAKRLREEHKGEKLLLIAVTGYQNDPDRLREAGFDQHMIKPLDMQKLYACIAAEDGEKTA